MRKLPVRMTLNSRAYVLYSDVEREHKSEFYSFLTFMRDKTIFQLKSGLGGIYYADYEEWFSQQYGG